MAMKNELVFLPDCLSLSLSLSLSLFFFLSLSLCPQSLFLIHIPSKSLVLPLSSFFSLSLRLSLSLSLSALILYLPNHLIRIYLSIYLPIMNSNTLQFAYTHICICNIFVCAIMLPLHSFIYSLLAVYSNIQISLYIFYQIKVR